MECSRCGREIENDGVFDNAEGVCNVCLNIEVWGSDPVKVDNVHWIFDPCLSNDDWEV